MKKDASGEASFLLKTDFKLTLNDFLIFKIKY
jgi:hypothetical protein